MGCTPNWERLAQPIEALSGQEQVTCHQEEVSPLIQICRLPSQKDGGQFLREEDRKSIEAKEQKIEYLKENKHFMDLSIEVSTEVTNVLLLLSKNPSFSDQGLTKLIGLNKKTLVKKQNRFNNLAKREEKAEFQLVKQKDRAHQKAQTQVFKLRGSIRLEKKFKASNKQNKTQQNLNYLNGKQRFSQKFGTIDCLVYQQTSLE